jgi:hypothetical protein
MYQGEDKEIIISATDENGDILPLTGYDIIWTAYNLTSGQIVLTKSSAVVGEIEVPVPANGQIQINLVSEDTATLQPKTYGHQCEVVDAFGANSLITAGQLTVIKSHTHSQL